jgi:putative addiction module killer protein
VQVTPKEILIYETEDGRAPFSEWMERQSKQVYGTVMTRLERVEMGNIEQFSCYSEANNLVECRFLCEKTAMTASAHLYTNRKTAMGDHRGVGDGVLELRIDVGPGYRVYFGKDGERLVILLIAGTKKTQRHDIDTAKQFWRDYHA